MLRPFDKPVVSQSNSSGFSTNAFEMSSPGWEQSVRPERHIREDSRRGTGCPTSVFRNKAMNVDGDEEAAQNEITLRQLSRIEPDSPILFVK
jgi:hypothetical protein